MGRHQKAPRGGTRCSECRRQIRSASAPMRAANWSVCRVPHTGCWNLALVSAMVSHARSASQLGFMRGPLGGSGAEGANEDALGPPGHQGKPPRRRGTAQARPGERHAPAPASTPGPNGGATHSGIRRERLLLYLVYQVRPYSYRSLALPQPQSRLIKLSPRSQVLWRECYSVLCLPCCIFAPHGDPSGLSRAHRA